MADNDDDQLPPVEPTLAPPTLAQPTLVERAEHAPMLEELLERASRLSAARFGGGTLVGECLDTHNPHLPGRIFVRSRGEDGKPVCAWLPVLDQLRVQPGCRVLLTRPDNWPEHVVLGVLSGLTDPQADSEPTPATAPEQPTLRLERGETLVVTNADGQPLLELSASESGPKLRLFQDDIAFEMPGRVRIGAERIELHSREGGVDIRSDGDTIVRSRFIRLN